MTTRWPGEVRVLEDADALASLGARRVADACGRAVAASGRFTWALAGGRTPEALYRRLAEPPLRESVAWERCDLFWGDERWVSSDDPRSNAGMARRAFAGKVPIPPERIHPIPAGAGDPEEAASGYDRLARAILGDPPRLDLILLGMGEDGHTASLFPHAALLAPADPRETAGGAREPLFAVARKEPEGEIRITATPALILEAGEILVLVQGAEKSGRLALALSSPAETAAIPITILRRAKGRVTWLCDREAAGAGVPSRRTASS